ncbi:TraX family protein [Porcipelethomonas sp.]|uniref:TraX family protein n=1 Tax=Porcipelethomonas sp. TaxID=2981675 RepID=UPI003EF74490
MAIDISNRPDRPLRKVTIHQKRKKGLTSDLLKLIAVIAMVIDHAAWAFVPFSSIAGQTMHVIGRLTAPIMCFMVAEGYYKTRNVKKYAQRLGIFALISHLPYTFFQTGKLEIINQTSIMFPLFLGLVALIIRDSPKYETAVKNMIILLICLASMIGDWGGIAVVYILIFGSNYNRIEKIKYFCAASAFYIILDIIMCAASGQWYTDLFKLGTFLAVPFLLKYNGVRRGGKTYKWFFYYFYPAHLLLLAVIKYVIL